MFSQWKSGEVFALIITGDVGEGAAVDIDGETSEGYTVEGNVVGRSGG
jgi:hypothetical protein